MKNNSNILIAIVLIIIIGGVVYFSKKPAPQNPIVVEDLIEGCYVASLSKDVYTLTILSQQGETVVGTLSFKNYQKDSSSGTFNGTYKDGILFGDYSFNSEGMDSVMQVIFKKQGNDFVRGYGDVDATGTRFTDLYNITYDTKAVFVASECAVSPV